ncbi:MAG: tetratricopeptide repeat protein [candidate division Zixibacteria bacterium]|nr:tetratricopeptide repeat protein [candidate division Zixibacteria bacterium]
MKPGGEEIDRTWDYIPTAQFIGAVEGYQKGKGTLKATLAEEGQKGKDPEFVYQLGWKLYSHRMYDSADARFAKVVALDSANASGKADDAILQRASICRRKEDWDGAVALSRDLLKRWPNGDLADDATIYIAYYSEKGGKKDQAITVYKEYLNRWPKGEDADFAKEQLEALQNPTLKEGGK